MLSSFNIFIGMVRCWKALGPFKIIQLNILFYQEKDTRDQANSMDKGSDRIIQLQVLRNFKCPDH